MNRTTALLCHVVVCVTVFLGGCTTIGNVGSSLRYNFQGEQYLKQKRFTQGIETFGEAVKNTPDNPEAQYYYGRFLLADNQASQALPHLKQAATLAPDKSDYHFWLGVALGETGQDSQERQSYEKALAVNPDNVQALTYMGNSLLRAGKYREALEYYRKTLVLWPENPQALYNKAVILRKLGRVSEEKLAWRRYLDTHPSGGFARLAADHLNSLGDYSYRNHRLGARTVTLTAIDFEPSSAELSPKAYPSLDLVGAAVSNMSKGVLNIVVYQRGDLNLARKRAISIGDYLARQYPDLKNNGRIRVSWFDVAEKRTVLKKKQRLDESVQFFLTDFIESKKTLKKK